MLMRPSKVTPIYPEGHVLCCLLFTWIDGGRWDFPPFLRNVILESLVLLELLAAFWVFQT